MIIWGGIINFAVEARAIAHLGTGPGLREFSEPSYARPIQAVYDLSIAIERQDETPSLPRPNWNLQNFPFYGR